MQHDQYWAYIYKWLYLRVFDNRTQLVGNATAEIVPTSTGSAALRAQVNTLNTFLDTDYIIKYLDRNRLNGSYAIDATTYLTTDDDGTPLRIPLLVSMMNLDGSAFGNTQMPNGEPVESYRAFANATVNSTVYNGIGDISFEPYPNMEAPFGREKLDIVYDTLVLPSPDFSIEAVDVNYAPLTPVSGDTVTITVDVHNIGQKTIPAGKADIRFYDTTEPVAVLFETVPLPVDLPSGGTCQVQADITLNAVKTFTFKVIADEVDRIYELREDNNEQTFNIVVSESWDFTVLNSEGINPSNTPYIGETVTITTRIKNNGNSLITTPFTVNLTLHNDSVSDIVLTSRQVFSYPAGQERDISFEWVTAHPDKVFTLTTEVDTLNEVAEYNETNNIRVWTKNLTVLGKPNLVVTNSNISLDMVYPRASNTYNLDAFVWNSGASDATDIWVRFYDDANHDGVLKTSEKIEDAYIAELNSSEEKNVTIQWTPDIPGRHDIYVWADWNETINEPDDDDNIGLFSIRVYNESIDLIVNDANTPVSILNSAEFHWNASVLVEQNGTLTISGTTFTLDQTEEHLHSITVRQNGTLAIKDSSLISDYRFNIYLYDNATLELINCELDENIYIMSYGNSDNNSPNNARILTEKAKVQGKFKTMDTINNLLLLRNSTFSYKLEDIGGNSEVYLYNTTTATKVKLGVELTGSAKAWRYAWLRVMAKDYRGIGIEGVNLSVKDIPNEYVKNSGFLTDANGIAFIPILTETIHTGKELENQLIEGNYTYSPTRIYYPVANKSVLLQTYKNVVLDFQTVYPDLAVRSITPVPNAPIVGDMVTLTVNVSNEGAAGSDATVLFYLGNVNPSNLLGTIETNIPSFSYNDSIALQWDTTDEIGNMQIIVVVDCTGDPITENNTGTLNIVVSEKIDLYPESIVFNPAEPEYGEPVDITVTVYNHGDVPANITLSIEEATDGAIGDIGIMNIPAYGSASNTFFGWVPLSSGPKNVQVTIDTDNNYTEANEGNNDMSEQVTIKDYANLVVTNLVFNPSISVTQGTAVTLTATVENQGDSSVWAPFNCSFYDGDPDDGGIFIDNATIAPLGVDGIAPAIVTWNAVNRGEHEIFAVADANATVREANDDDNDLCAMIFVVEAPFDLIVNPGNSPYIIPEGVVRNLNGYVFIENGGTLRVRGTLNFKINSQIMIQDGGKLECSGTISKDSGRTVGMSMFGNSELECFGGALGINQITMYDDATLDAENCTLPSITAEDEVYVEVDNATISGSLNFYDNTTGNLTSVTTIPTVKDNAMVSRYWHLHVTAQDQLDDPVDGAVVNVTNFILPGFTARTTNAGGNAWFKLLAEDIEGAGATYFSSIYDAYIVNGTVTVNTVDHYAELNVVLDQDIDPGMLVFDSLKFRPELLLENLVLNETYDFGEVVALEVDVNNTGHSNAGNFDIEFYDVTEDIVFHTANIPLAAGTVQTELAGYTPTITGTHTIRITVDINEAVLEHDEDNNILEATFYVNKKADLSASELVIGPAAMVTAGSVVTFQATIQNNGESGTAGTFDVEFYDGDPNDGGVLLDTDAGLGPLDADAELQANGAWAAVYGVHDIYVLVDSTDAVNESNEDNNANLYQSIDVREAELYPENFAPAATYHFDQQIVLDVDVTNDGASDANNFVLEFYDTTEKAVIDTQVISVPAGTTQNFVAAGYTPTKDGTHTFTVTVDKDDDIHELNENNNTITAQTIIHDMADIVITGITVEPSYYGFVFIGDDVNVTIDLENQGDSNTLTQYTVDMYIGGTLVNTTNVGPTASMGTETVTFPWTADVSGQVTILVDADTGDAVPEMDDDNAYSTTIMVLQEPYDLVVDNGDTYRIRAGVTRNIYGNVLVRNGTLLIEGTLHMREITSIMIMENGTLEMDGGSIVTDKSVEMTIYGGAIELNDAYVDLNTIYAYGGSNLTINGSEMTEVRVYDDSILYTRDTFYDILRFNGDSNGTMVNVSYKPNVLDNAVVRKYWWLEVQAYDGTGQGLEDVSVTAANIIDPAMWINNHTDPMGRSKIALLSDLYEGLGATTKRTSYSSWKLWANYTFAGTNYSTALDIEDNVMLEYQFDDISPDLEVVDVGFNQVRPMEGTVINVHVNVTNNGIVDGIGMLTLNRDDEEGDELAAVSIRVNASETEYFLVTFDSLNIFGNVTVFAVVDLENDFAPGNNVDHNNITILQALPDLIVTDIEPQDANLLAGEFILFDITVENVGYEALDEEVSLQVEYRIGTTWIVTIAQPEIDHLDVGESCVETIAWVPDTAGDYSIYAFIDYYEDQAEMDEDNNEYYEDYSVSGKPNLAIIADDISFSDSTPIIPEGQETVEITITARVQNNGMGAITSSGQFYVDFYVDGAFLETVTVNGAVTVGSARTLNVDWYGDRGEHEIMVDIRSGNVNEVTTSDNDAVASLLVLKDGAPGDLIVNEDEIVTIMTFYNLRGNILVEDNGTLNLYSGMIQMLQDDDNQYQVIVKDYGTLTIMDGDIISSDTFDLNLYDHATLEISDSELSDKLNIRCNGAFDGGSNQMHVSIMDSIVKGEFSSYSGANTMLDAEDSDLRKTISSFKGNSYGNITNTKIQDPTLSENAQLDIYALVKVEVVDINDQPVTGAELELLDYLTMEPIAFRDGVITTTPSSGFLTVPLKTYEYHPPKIDIPVANYRMKAAFLDPLDDEIWHNETVAVGDLGTFADNIRYPETTTLTIKLDDVGPNLDPPIKTVPESVAKQEDLKIVSYINNSGINDAYDVPVSLYYVLASRIEEMGNLEIIHDLENNSAHYSEFRSFEFPRIPMGGSEKIDFTTTVDWDPNDYAVIVLIDPDYHIKEISANRADNINYAEVEVFGRPDFSIVSSKVVEPIYEGSSIIIDVTVRNDGDEDGRPDIKLYLDSMDDEPIGTLNNFFVGAKTTSPSSTIGTWYVPSSGIAGVHTLYFTVDDDEEITEYNDNNNHLSRAITIYRRAELNVTIITPSFQTGTQAKDGESVGITCQIRNEGEKAVFDAVVRFFVDNNTNGAWDQGLDSFIADVNINEILPGQTENAETLWEVDSKYASQEFHIGAYVNPTGTNPLNEYDMDNNQLTIPILVVLERDIYINSEEVVTQPVGEEGEQTTQIRITAKVHSLDQSSKDVIVYFYNDYNEDGILQSEERILPKEASQSKIASIAAEEADMPSGVTTTVTWDAKGKEHKSWHEIYISVNHGEIINEINYTNNLAHVRIKDPRPDLLVVAGSFNFTEFDTNEPQETMLTPLNLTIRNVGGIDVNNVVLTLYDNQYIPDNKLWSSLEKNKIIDIPAGEEVEITANITMYTIGHHTLLAVVDPTNITLPNEKMEDFLKDNENLILSNYDVIPDVLKVNEVSQLIQLDYGMVDECIELNNTAAFNFNVTAPPIEVRITSPSSETKFFVNDDDLIDVRGSITPVPRAYDEVLVTISFLKNGQPYGSPYETYIKKNGNFQESIPSPDETGIYYVEVLVEYGDTSVRQPGPAITMDQKQIDSEFPLWMILAIIIAVAAAIGASSFYLYKYGLGKFVECGECGSLIPAGESVCPKCGVEFEGETAKCSVCGAWIPIISEVCPDCGAEFKTATKEEKVYREQMRDQYEEFLEPYKAEARKELGKDMSEEDFLDWWKKHPDYVTFDAWLILEETRREVETPIKCPACGTLNPPDSTMCSQCGRPIETEDEPVVLPKKIPQAPVEAEEVEEVEEKPAPKKVVKKPAPVEKKVVKQPAPVEKKEVAKPQPVKPEPVKPQPLKPQPIVAKKVVAKQPVQPAEQQVVTPKKVVKKKVIRK